GMSECAGRVNEFRHDRVAGADVLETSEGRIAMNDMGKLVAIPPGSKSRACTYKDSSGTWEAHRLHRLKTAWVTPGSNHLAACCRQRHAERNKSQRWYRPARQRAGGDGRQGIGVRHSTEEAGKRSRADPTEERAYQHIESLEGHMT